MDQLPAGIANDIRRTKRSALFRGIEMKTGSRSALNVALTVALALSGCATQPKPLYHWGNYQSQVYAYFKGDGESVEAQQSKLEATAQQAQAKGTALPPGFNAHLGLLYLNTGQADKARAAFQTEEAQFPESKPYMDFLMKKFNQTKLGDAR